MLRTIRFTQLGSAQPNELKFEYFMDIGRMLITFGIILVIVGLLSYVFPLFKLPGDISIRREGFSFHFPIVTSIVISIILTILLNIFFRR